MKEDALDIQDVYASVENELVYTRLFNGVKSVAGDMLLDSIVEVEDDFKQLVLKLKPAYSKHSGEYGVIAELTALLYCSAMFNTPMTPIHPAWHNVNAKRLHGLIDGETAEYLQLDIRNTDAKEILIDLELDTSYLESRGYYLVYFTPKVKIGA